MTMWDMLAAVKGWSRDRSRRHQINCRLYRSETVVIRWRVVRIFIFLVINSHLTMHQCYSLAVGEPYLDKSSLTEWSTAGLKRESTNDDIAMVIPNNVDPSPVVVAEEIDDASDLGSILIKKLRPPANLPETSEGDGELIRPFRRDSQFESCWTSTLSDDLWSRWLRQMHQLIDWSTHPVAGSPTADHGRRHGRVASNASSLAQTGSEGTKTATFEVS